MLQINVTLKNSVLPVDPLQVIHFSVGYLDF
jgi:hypothetical protein